MGNIKQNLQEQDHYQGIHILEKAGYYFHAKHC